MNGFTKGKGKVRVFIPTSNKKGRTEVKQLPLTKKDLHRSESIVVGNNVDLIRKKQSIDGETIPMREGMKWAVIHDEHIILLEFPTLREAKESVGSFKLSKEFRGSYEDENGVFFVKISDVSQKEYGNWVRETVSNLEEDRTTSQEIVDHPEENEGIEIEFYRKNVIGRTNRLEAINPDSISQGEEE